MKRLQRQMIHLLALTLMLSGGLGLILTTGAGRVRAATLTVTNNNDSGAGSLRQAIADAVAGDTIDFAPSLTGTITLTSGELVIDKNLTINGPGAKVLTVSGNNTSRVFSIGTGRTVSIGGLTISRGSLVAGDGGGLHNSGTLTMNDCLISDNSAPRSGVDGSGGGLHNSGTLTMNDCLISDNSAPRGVGGGIYNRVGAVLTINNSTISFNSSNNGGGISNVEGQVTANNCTISNNSAFVNGGGINNGQTLESPLSTVMTNCTVTGNSATVGGGGIGAFGRENFKNTIVAGNFKGSTPNDVQSSIRSASHCLIGDAATAGGIADGVNGNIVGVGGTGTRDINTILNTFLADYGGPTATHLLVCGSPALNAGDNALAASLTTDQRGAPRVFGGTVDIGAVEMQNVVTNLNDSGTGSLRQAIANAASGSFIDVDPCVSGTITLTTGELLINKSLVINGPGAKNLTVSGNNTSRVFEIASGNTAGINGFAIANGHVTGEGNGAGILNFGRLIVATCTIANSSAALTGGGIHNATGASLTITDSTISNNSAFAGGGISSIDASLILSNSTISNNTVNNAGGGVLNAGANGTLTATNCTITGNSAGGGGGIHAQRTETLNNTIVAGNFKIPAMVPNDINTFNGPIETANHTLIGNAGSAGGIIDGTNGNIVGIDGVGTRNINTILNTTLADNGGPTKTHALVCGSPAIDGGSNSFASGLDQRGSRRIFDGNGDNAATIDIGAVEKENACPSITPQPVSVARHGSSPDALLATVNDLEDAEDSLAVTVNNGSSATVNGVTVGNLEVAANGNVTGTVSASCAATSATFTLAVTDSGSQTAQATLSVTVTASAPPAIICPGNITKSADPGQCSAVVNFAATATDDCTTITPVCSPSSGSSFPKGTTTVTCTATDADGQAATCLFTVTVSDSQAPSIACPTNVTKVNDPNTCGAVVTFPLPTVSDNCPGVKTPVCSPASGSSFPKGTTTVNCSVSDAAGNSSNCSFSVTVQDTQPPVIACPANITGVTPTTGASTVVVNFGTPIASDNCGTPTVVCSPASGSAFPIGTTTVTCTAADGSGNTSSCSFIVTTFDVCVQDDSTGKVLLWNSVTGDYRFCWGGTPVVGIGTVTRRGSTFTLTHNTTDRRVSGSVDSSQNKGNASLQTPPGVMKCTITDRDLRNNSCQCG